MNKTKNKRETEKERANEWRREKRTGEEEKRIYLKRSFILFFYIIATNTIFVFTNSKLVSSKVKKKNGIPFCNRFIKFFPS